MTNDDIRNDKSIQMVVNALITEVIKLLSENIKVRNHKVIKGKIREHF